VKRRTAVKRGGSEHWQAFSSVAASVRNQRARGKRERKVKARSGERIQLKHQLRPSSTSSAALVAPSALSRLLSTPLNSSETMASRGGRGGGRGGRGGASGKPQPPVGHLQYADIIEHSKTDTNVLYPVRSPCCCRIEAGGGDEADFPP
jgi:hypothetical protein